MFQKFGVFSNMNFENLGLEEITEIVDLVKFPMSIWLQNSASIQPRASLFTFECQRFCRSQFRSHAEPLVDVFAL